LIIDLIVIGVLTYFIMAGFKSGFIPMLFGLIGYVGGGFLGLISARELASEWSGFWSVIGLHILLIFISARLGQAIARKLGKGFRDVFGPLKFLDSLLGALLGGIKAFLFVVVLLLLSSVLPNEGLKEQLNESRTSQYLDSHLPSLIADGFSRVLELSPS
jgi:uncharacterized membrane protein required for colicin V production